MISNARHPTPDSNISLTNVGPTLGRQKRRWSNIEPIYIAALDPNTPSIYCFTQSLFRNTVTLRWRHNGCDSVSNHQPHHCLLNRLFRRRSKKTSKRCVTGVCARGIHRRPVNSPHKWPVTREMLPFDDVIMTNTQTSALLCPYAGNAQRLYNAQNDCFYISLTGKVRQSYIFPDQC